MILVPPGVRILLAARPVDFRKGMDGLAALVQQALRADPFRGDVFIFRPKRPSAVAVRHQDELAVAEVAARLNLPEATVYNWLHKGRLPARRVAAAWHTLWLLRLDDVEALLCQRTGGGRLPPRQAAP